MLSVPATEQVEQLTGAPADQGAQGRARPWWRTTATGIAEDLMGPEDAMRPATHRAHLRVDSREASVALSFPADDFDVSSCRVAGRSVGTG